MNEVEKMSEVVWKEMENMREWGVDMSAVIGKDVRPAQLAHDFGKCPIVLWQAAPNTVQQTLLVNIVNTQGYNLPRANNVSHAQCGRIARLTGERVHTASARLAAM